MSDVVIKVEGLSKAYRLGVQSEKPETLVEVLVGLAKAPFRNFRRLRRLNTFSTDRESADILWALKDVSFEVRQGEVVGFVGRNGAGKSTLLKILSRITDPTEGRVEIHGRVSSLLEVGTGFHPELTGRENVYMNGTILGMKKREIDQKFDEIVEFSGVERFLDTPVKRYSSGMKVRLAFSVAAHLEPELLIVDEVLAVGDADFQRKCLGKMQDVAGGGRTVLFVSHNMVAIENLCSRALLFTDGQVVEDNQPTIVVQSYLDKLLITRPSGFVNNKDRITTSKAVFISGRLLDAEGRESVKLFAGRPSTFEFSYSAPSDNTYAEVVLTIFNHLGVPVTQMRVGDKIKLFERGMFIFELSQTPLPIGHYALEAKLILDNGSRDLIPVAFTFDVVNITSIFQHLVKSDIKWCTAFFSHFFRHISIPD